MQQPHINQIPIKNSQYRNLKIQNIVVEKEIYRDGQLCDVKFVKIQQLDQQNPVLPQQIKKTKYALKVISKQKIQQRSDSYERQYANIYNQIVSLYLVDHPNIIKIHWHCEDSQNIYILTEYGGLKLYNYSRKQQLTEEKIKDIFRQICEGVRELHQRNIMHRDLCLENIVISSQNNLVKIIDFGNTAEFTFGRTTALGTLSIMAPQVYHQKRYNSKADIWSLGVLLYELFHKCNPFVDQTKELDAQQFQKQLSEKRDKLEYTIDSILMSPQACAMIKRMLSLNPQNRPSIDSILKSKWITGNEPSIESRAQQKSIQSDDDNKKTKQITKQRRSYFQLSQTDPINKQQQNQQIVEQNRPNTDRDDDFYFDKIINKMSIQNSIPQLQRRLHQLLKIRAYQLNKKKILTLQYISIVKSKVQDEIKKLRQ